MGKRSGSNRILAVRFHIDEKIQRGKLWSSNSSLTNFSLLVWVLVRYIYVVVFDCSILTRVLFSSLEKLSFQRFELL
jgi:hypothetical protein